MLSYACVCRKKIEYVGIKFFCIIFEIFSLIFNGWIIEGNDMAAELVSYFTKYDRGNNQVHSSFP